GGKKLPPTDLYGDPLPPNALARVGTMRLQHESGVQCSCFLPGNRTLATGGFDGSIRFWDTDTGKEMRVFRGHRADIRCLAFTPDGKTMASASWDTTVRLWDVASGKTLHVLSGHQTAALRCAFVPNGKRLVTSDGSGTLRQWDVASGKKLPGFVGHADYVTTLAYTPDGRMLISAAHDRTVRLWEGATTRPRQVIPLPAVSLAGGVQISPDGKTMAVVRKDKTIRVVDLVSGKELHTLRGYKRFASFFMIYSPDGKALVSYDQGMDIWDLKSGKLL